jgi:hypothetical protein
MHSLSTDYRENARLCLDLAKRAAKPEHAQTLRNIAKAWLKLADELKPQSASIEPAGAEHLAAAGPPEPEAR